MTDNNQRFVSTDKIRAEVWRVLKDLFADDSDESFTKALGEAINNCIHDYHHQDLMPLLAERLARLDALDKKIEESEARLAALKAFTFQGAWEDGRQYNSGNFVSHGGAVFHANADTKSKPGNGSADWTLAVARGRDGRDAK
jgi:hypothetical protein